MASLTPKEAIEQHGVKKEFVVMYAGWECDDRAWLLNNGQLVFTSHGKHFFADNSALVAKRQEAEKYLVSLVEIEELHNAMNTKESVAGG